MESQWRAGLSPETLSVISEIETKLEEAHSRRPRAASPWAAHQIWEDWMKKSLVLLAILVSLLLVACNGTRKGERDLIYYHDDIHNVTCWQVQGVAGLACISDRQLDVR